MDLNANSETQKYELSGAYGARFFMAIISTIVLAVVIGTLYGALRYYVLWTPLRWLLGVGCGMLLGAVLVGLMKRLHCRNSGAITLVGVLGGLFAAYSSEVEHLWLLFSGNIAFSFWDLLLDPIATWDLFTFVASNGVFTRDGKPMSAGEIYFFWGLEIVGFFVVSMYQLSKDSKKLAYCEPCQKWLDLSVKSLYFGSYGSKQTRAQLCAGDLAAFQGMQLAGGLQIPGVRVDYDLCSSCGNKGVYRIVEITFDSNNYPKDVPLSPLMELNSVQVAHLGVFLATIDGWIAASKEAESVDEAKG